MSWKYDGSTRPPFAEPASGSQESVWDYPRPPVIVPDSRPVVVRSGDVIVAETRAALRILETASPPTFYLPLRDVREDLLEWHEGGSVCEWKGVASYCDLVLSGRRQSRIGWRYPRPTQAFAAITSCVSFYPGRIECYVAGERVRPQPGGFYGGWLTNEIVGPVKGQPGAGHW